MLKYFKSKLEKIGFDIGHSQTPITPIMIGDEALTMAFFTSFVIQWSICFWNRFSNCF